MHTWSILTVFTLGMASPQRNSKDLQKMISDTKEDMDYVQRTLEKLQGLSPDEKEAGILRSRIDEQSSLICILKQRSDETLLRCQALQKINTDLEGLIANGQKELMFEKKKSTMIEKRFMELASNHQEIINFKDEYKRQNAQLRLENEHLRTENEMLFSKEVQDKEALVHKLTQEMIQLAEKHKNMENEHQEKVAGLQLKLKEQMAQHQSKEASLLDELRDVQQQLRDAAEMCTGLKVQLQKAGNDHSLKEARMKESIASLTKQKDTFLTLSMERGKVIQENQEEIQQLESRWKEEEKARVVAEVRFKREAAVVNADIKVRDLQSALDDSVKICEKLKRDFEAYKEHSTNLLTQEKELNAKLRHMIG